MRKSAIAVLTAGIIALSGCGSSQHEAKQVDVPTTRQAPTAVATTESTDDIIDEADKAGDKAAKEAEGSMAALLAKKFIKTYCPKADDLSECTDAEPVFKQSTGFWPTPDNDVRASFNGTLSKEQRDSVAILVAGAAVEGGVEFEKLSVSDDDGDHVYSMDSLVKQVQGE